jgi:hypothetical protein
VNTAGQGPVVLDIGDEVGAVVVVAPARLAGAEIEVCPAGSRSERPDEGRGWWSGDWRSHSARSQPVAAAWPHVAVLRRTTPAGARYAAVFPGLRAGRYELWLRPAQPTALTVSVSGGAVTDVAWPTGQDE